MFAHLRRLLLRRCLHTQIPQNTRARTFNGRLGVTAGASVAVASYLTWRITYGQRIALDSATSLESSKKALSVDGPSSKTTPPPDNQLDSSQSGVAETSNTTTSNIPQSKQFPTEGEKTEGQNQSSTEGEGASGGGGGGGAFNPVTGEINWDCPCLGGMAYGPCGEEFRDAFSCFVCSEEEPKGINCVDKFKAMQTCFRAHPEVYKDEIMDDDDEDPQTQPDSANSKPSTEPQKDTSVSSADQNPLPTPSQSSQTDTPATQA